MVDIRIEKRDGAIAWRQDIKRMERDMRITVDDGCEAIAFAGGTRLNTFHGGTVEMLNESGRLQRQFRNVNFYFLVCNTQQPVSVRWGVGKNPVSYQDRILEGAMLSVSAYGKCEVTVYDAAALWANLSDEVKSDNIVDANEISAHIQREIIARVGPILSQELAKIGDYTKIPSSVNQLNRVLKTHVGGLESMGLTMSKVYIEGLNFTEQAKEFIALAQERAKTRIEKDVVQAQAEQIQSIIKAVDSDKKED